MVQCLRPLCLKTLFPSNCHQVEKRQICSEKQNEISYGVRL